MTHQLPFINAKKDSPPPPYSRYYNDETQLNTSPVIDPNDSTQSQLSTVSDSMPPLYTSTETGGTLQYGYGNHTKEDTEDCANGSPHREWCKLAYWELQTRVGKLFKVHTATINVFSNAPHEQGFCISDIVKRSPPNHESQSDAVKRTRDKIGYGVTLSHNETGVYVYNRSKYPIFVNSPTLDRPNTRHLTVFKVLPSNIFQLFDYRIAKIYKKVQKSEPPDGPYDPNAVRISFVKGWGTSGYSRQFLYSCPCWLEVLLTVPR